jgi:hypothetical protein
MTDSNLLELAKLGDPQAIATLMNQSLQSRGMSATVDRQDDCLEVILEGERVPNRQALTAFVQQGINNLGVQSIRSIRIVGQQFGASYPAWMQEIQIGAQGKTLGNVNDLNDLTSNSPTADNLAASNLTAAPLNIQPETESEITVIPSDDWMQSDAAVQETAAADINPNDLSFLPDADPNDLTGDLAFDALSDPDLANTDLDSTDDILAALTEPTASVASPESEAWSTSEIDIAPDFLQELLADTDESERSLFAESPDGSLDTLEGSLTSESFSEAEWSEAEMDLLFDDFDQTSDNPSEPLPETTETLGSVLDETAETPAASEAELLDFLNQAEVTELPSNRLNNAELNELTEAPLPAPPSTPADDILNSQIEDLFDAEMDSPGGVFIEEVLPERPSATGEDLRQALVDEAPTAASLPEPLEDPWTVSILPELSEARTVIDLSDDDPTLAADRPEFPVDPPDAEVPIDQLFTDTQTDSFPVPEADDDNPADATNDLEALFGDEEPPVSMPTDSIFYGTIADEEIAEADLEELPPDFLQDFSAEFPDGFPSEFTEVEAPTLDAAVPEEPIPQDLALTDDFFTEPIEPHPSMDSDLAAELAALDLTTDAKPSSLDPALTDVAASEFTDLTDTDSTDADLADLLSETPQGRPLTEAMPPATSPPQPEDFFTEPIAPSEVPSTSSSASSETADVSKPQLRPDVSQDALEAGLGDFREGLVEPLPEEFFADETRPAETDWQADLRDPLDLSDDTEADYIIEDSTPAVIYTPPPLPTSEKTQSTPDRGTPAWLFPLVLLFVVAWIAGLLGFALFRSSFEPLPSPPPAGESPEAPPPVEPAAPASPTSQQPNPLPAANLDENSPLELAIEQASDAVALTQAAQSSDDWKLVASKWQQAINLLRTVPNTSPEYATAQQKRTEYEANMATAREKANLPIVAAAPLGAANIAQAERPEANPIPNPNANPTVSPTVSSTSPIPAEVDCNSVAPAANSQPVELSRVQFDPTADLAEASPIVGCITNHTEQSIATVNVVYRSRNRATAPATGNLNFGQLEPKATVPFKSAFTVAPQVKDLTIASISWIAAGTSNAKQFPAAINITRTNQGTSQGTNQEG